MAPTNALANVAPTQNAGLSTILMGLKQQFINAAQENVAQADDGFTAAEKNAMVKIEALKLVGGMDLAAILLRWDLIQEIEAGALHTLHPEGYQTFDEMARAQGIAPSELSDIRALCGTIFPWIENQLGVQVAVIWEQIGKSNFRDMVPVLRAIITGEAPDRTQTRNVVTRLMDDAAATMAAAGQAVTPEGIQRAVVQEVLTAGLGTNTELRRRIRPERTEPIEPTFINVDGETIMVAKLTADQMDMLNRILRAHMDPQIVTLPENRRQRQQEAARIALLRELHELLEG